MRLEEIGFYTLSDERARRSGCEEVKTYNRCEILLTDRCNFKCPYCKEVREDCRGTMGFSKAKGVIDRWASRGLINVRFSGGEPTIYSSLLGLVRYTADRARCEHIAVSTNGSSDIGYYKDLILAGVNDFSISLDACCASFGKVMSGGTDAWRKVVGNIEALSKLVYVTVGIVFTEDNVGQAKETIEFADKLGVSDIRIISSAQYNDAISGIDGVSDEILNRHPILKYRVNNFRAGRNVRGMRSTDCPRCHLVKDDMAVAGDYHFPCIIYLREGGNPIGRVDGDMLEDRMAWFETHDCSKDKICHGNCLDVCIDYNNKAEEFAKGDKQ